MTDREKFEAWFGKKKQEMMNRNVPVVKIISICKLQWSAWQAALASQQTADEGWIEWAGGKCPVRADAIVDVKWYCGSQSDFGKAYYWSWEHYDYEDNIIAYRVVKP